MVDMAYFKNTLYKSVFGDGLRNGWAANVQPSNRLLTEIISNRSHHSYFSTSLF